MKGFLSGKQPPLPMVSNTGKKILSGEIDARAEISDGKTVLVVYFSGDGSEQQIADELFSRITASVCCVDADQCDRFISGQGVSSFPTYVYYSGGHEISRLEEDASLDRILSWIEGVTR